MMLLSYPKRRLSRRRFVTGASSALALSSLPISLSAQQPVASAAIHDMSGSYFDLTIDYQPVKLTGRSAIATTVNQKLPGPVLHWKEGDRVKLRVTNRLTHESSIHWHGIILPSEMDGTPGLSFSGIKPGETFEYEFDVRQNGTYWYHSHSAFQEQTGLLGAIIIDSETPEPFHYDRDMVILLSDWSDEAPETVYAKLKKASHYYNYREKTLSDTWRDIRRQGFVGAWRNNAMWNQMRMSQTDISDVTGHTYTYLMNGVSPANGWLGLFKVGEKIRLRFINGAAMTLFDVRIPGLKMTVIAADGQWIKPVVVDEFRMGTAETYDVIVEPEGNRAYTLFAQSIDRSGYAWGRLTPDFALLSEIPAMDALPVLGHRDMGMDMSSMDHGDHHGSHQHNEMHSADNAKKNTRRGAQEMPEHMTHEGHAGHDMSQMNKAPVLAKAGFGHNFDEGERVSHPSTEIAPFIDMQTEAPASGLSDPGIGLRQHAERLKRKVLTYADLKNYYPTRDKRQPSREIILHLTGNMWRYLWSLNGIKFANAEPIILNYGERVRIVLVNDTMMTHPIHLHGMWSELETGDPDYIPRKHTILVQPGSKISYLVTADAPGRWAYHCHLMYHMPGMMREVRVVKGEPV